MILLERKEIKETKHKFFIVQLLTLLLQDTVKTAGAEVSGEGIIETFRNDDEALDAADNGVVVCILFCNSFIPVAKRILFSLSLHEHLYLKESF